MTTATSNTNRNWHNACGPRMSVQFDNVNQPGCYVCNWSGHLLRVPEDSIAPGRSPLINFVGREPLFVTMISDNPYIPVTKARLMAANHDVPVNF